MRSRTSSLSLLIVAAGLLAACGGGDSPVEPPPQRLPANVQLKAQDILVFAGQKLSLRSLVLRVTDSNGAVLTDYTLGAELPAGWTVRNDSVIAPATETVARLKVTATYLPPSTSALPLFARSAGAMAQDDTATVTSGVDLKARKWRVSYSCSNAGYNTGTNDEGVYVDSVRVVEASVDSVIYASDSTWIPQFGGVAQLYASGSMVRWMRDSTRDTIPYFNHHVIQRQAPDSIITEQTSQGKKAMVRVTPGTLNQLLRYEGGTFCSNAWHHERGSVTMQEVAAESP